MADEPHGPAMEPVAIIGMASVFPEARYLEQFWENIVRERDCITDVPPSRWNIDDYYDPDPSTPDKTYCKRGGFIPDVDFDPLEFGLPPNILEVTEVSQLLGLVVARECFEDAGYGTGRKEFNRERTGVVLGIGGGQKLITPLTSRLQYPIWQRVLERSGLSAEAAKQIVDKIKLAYIPWEENSFPGMLGNVISGRIANRFDLGGINCVVDAACASSLSAMKLAISELHERRSDLVLTGGVDTDNSPFMYMCFSKTPAFSKQDRVSPFDVDSDGMMLGEGIAMFALKRLADAERDDDRIYAVIRGIGTSSDGRSGSIYAPRPQGQVRALRRAYEDAGIAPNSIGLIEAHGTGTIAGDLCEVRSLREVFGSDAELRGTVALGSVKSQIGHTKAAAGAAGLMKAALALHHKVLPASINVSEPSPKFELDGSPLYINTATRPWIGRAGGPRRAGVSAFGFGGTNFHVVLEEHQAEHKSAYRLHRTSHEIVLSAATPDGLRELCMATRRELDGEAPDQAFTALIDSTASNELPQSAARLGFVAEGPAECGELLDASLAMFMAEPAAEVWEHPRGIHYRRHGMDTAGKVVALFPGQGSQYVDMGRSLAVNFPAVREAFRLIDEAAEGQTDVPVSDVVFPPPAFHAGRRAEQDRQLVCTEYAQPALGALSVGMFELLRQAGFQPDFAAGHSFGEVIALWAAGCLSDADCARLAVARGQAMRRQKIPGSEAGAMLVVSGQGVGQRHESLEIAGMAVANVNGPDQVVLGGPSEAVEAAERELASAGYRTTRLQVDTAFHTELVRRALPRLREGLARCEITSPRIPVFANATGEAYPSDPTEIRTILTEQLIRPVNFMQQIQAIYRAGGSIFVEFGPRNVLTNLVSSILGGQPHVAISLNPSRQGDSDRQLRQAIVELRVLGVPLQTVDGFQRTVTRSNNTNQETVVRLGGNNYVSETTHAAFDTALQESADILPAPAKPTTIMKDEAMTTPALQLVAARESVPDPSEEPTVSSNSAIAALADNQPPTAAEPRPVIAEPPPSTISLALNQRFTQNQAEFVRILTDAVQDCLDETTTLSASESAARVVAIARLQAATLGLHERFLEQQTSAAALLAGQQQSPANDLPTKAMSKQAVVEQVAPGPAAARSGAAPATSRLPTAGTSTLPLQRSQSNGSATAPAKSPAPTTNDSTKAAMAWSTDDVVRVSNVAMPAGGVALLSAPVEVPAAEPVTLAEPVAVVESADFGQLRDSLLEVVSEKTGYPVSTLGLEMDLEADLGIDSIKRVHILSVVQERFPDLPPMEPEVLGELRTLQEIVDYLGGLLNPAAGGGSPTATEPATGAEPVAVAESAGFGQLRDSLLEVVSEKTGYPVSTLGLEMDLEADLGIDSIKRVHILSVVQERFPDLPPMEPEVLGELRTLQEIVDYLGGLLNPAAGGGSPDESAAAGGSWLPHAGVHTIVLPAPDQLDSSPMPGATCLITDDGTEATARLAEALADRGWKPVVIRLPLSLVDDRATLPRSIVRLDMTDTDDKTLVELLRQVTDHYGPVASFVHLHPYSRQAGGLVSPAGEQIAEYALLMAKNLGQHLAEAARHGRASFVTVAHLDGELGTGRSQQVDVAAGSLSGLVKTLRREWPEVFCRAIDIGTALSPSEQVSAIMTEFADPDRRIAEVGYGPAGRVTLTASQDASEWTP